MKTIKAADLIVDNIEKFNDHINQFDVFAVVDGRRVRIPDKAYALKKMDTPEKMLKSWIQDSLNWFPINYFGKFKIVI